MQKHNHHLAILLQHLDLLQFGEEDFKYSGTLIVIGPEKIINIICPQTIV